LFYFWLIFLFVFLSREIIISNVSQSINHLISHSINHSINHLINHSINQSFNHSINHLINHSINQSFNQSINHLINHSINQSFNQSFNQSLNQSFNQSVNQSVSQSVSQSKRIYTAPYHKRIRGAWRYKTRQTSCSHSLYSRSNSLVFAARSYASAAYAVMRCLSVCPPVCPSRLWILSKRINVSTFFFTFG